MIGLLRLLREHADVVEADLSRYYGLDLRDRWRYDDGKPRLTLRMIAVRLRHIPMESAVARLENDGTSPWTRIEHLLDELRRGLEVLAGVKKPKPDPGRKIGEVRRTPALASKLAAARARKRARAQRLAAARSEKEG